MIVISEPSFAWQPLHFACPKCGGVVQFEVADVTGLKGIKPRQDADGRWMVTCQCTWCRTVETFRQVTT